MKVEGTTFSFENAYTETKRKDCVLKPNDITILVGRNGYGKSSFLQGLKKLVDGMENALVVEWNDNEYGRGNGMSRMSWEEDYSGLASMVCRSEGQRMLTSIAKYLISRTGYTVRKCRDEQHDTFFILADQLDSGLDVAQLNRIKKLIRNLIIPDMNESGLTVYVVLSANSFEMVNGEDCLDPITRTHHRFKSLKSYTTYITKQYQPDEIGDK